MDRPGCSAVVTVACVSEKFSTRRPFFFGRGLRHSADAIAISAAMGACECLDRRGCQMSASRMLCLEGSLPPRTQKALYKSSTVKSKVQPGVEGILGKVALSPGVNLSMFTTRQFMTKGWSPTRFELKPLKHRRPTACYTIWDGPNKLNASSSSLSFRDLLTLTLPN